mgnify:CR=1 FL=1
MKQTVCLTDDDLFGNEAGEDERPEILNDYFVDSANFAPFRDPGRCFAVVRARKGMGKSALLAKVAFEKREGEDTIVVVVRGSDLSRVTSTTATEPNTLINGWEQEICRHINLAIGRHLRIALDDTTMTLVESAEIAGVRGRNIIGALLDRLRGKLGSEIRTPSD